MVTIVALDGAMVCGLTKKVVSLLLTEIINALSLSIYINSGSTTVAPETTFGITSCGDSCCQLHDRCCGGSNRANCNRDVHLLTVVFILTLACIMDHAPPLPVRSSLVWETAMR